MPAAEDVAASIYRWERGTVSPSDRYRLYYCHALGIPPDRFGDPAYDPAQDVPQGHHHHQPARRHRHPAQAHQPGHPARTRHGHLSPHAAQHHA